MKVDGVKHARIDSTAAPHPKEMKGEVRFQPGSFSFETRFRATPAGLITAAILVAAVPVPVALIARQRARDDARENMLRLITSDNAN